MFKPILLSAVLVLLGWAGSVSGPAALEPAALGPAAAQAGGSGGGRSFSQLPADVQTRVKAIYKIDCAICHGNDGNGQTDVAKSMNLTMQNWTDGKVLAAKGDAELFAMIRKGKEPMPPEPEDRATDAQVRALVLYIRGMAKATPDAVPAAAPAGPATPNATHP